MTKLRYCYVVGRPGVDGQMARLAEMLLEDVRGAGNLDVIKLAEEFQLAYEGACQEIEALFREEKFTESIHDCCCGYGNIVVSARAAGYFATGTDIRDRGFLEGGVRDFFDPDFERVDNLVFNPPFAASMSFARRAVRLVRYKVAMIFPTRRLNAAGHWLEELPLSRIWLLTPRPSMPPGDVYRALEAQGKTPSGGTQDFCWLIMSPRRHTGSVTVDWLRR